MKKYKKIYLEITSACNLACSFCPPTKRQKQFLAVEEFSRRLDQLKPHTDHLYFHVKGEPLLHPKIHELLDISHEKGFRVNLTTNGTLLAQRQAQLLHKPALRQMNISLHSLDGQEGAQDMEGYLHPILAFVKEALRQTDMMISLRFWNLTPGTAEGETRNRKLLEPIERAFALDYRIEEKGIPGRGLKIAHRLYLHQDYEFQWPSLQAEEDDGKGFCYGLRHQVGILTDGTVVPCCLDGEGILALGNLTEKPFSEILTMDRAKNLVDGFSRRVAVEELCRKCGYRKRFGSSLNAPEMGSIPKSR